MAKKSEFAQKLLEDLRMRKEKMAAGSGKQTYSQSYSSTSAQGHRSERVAASSIKTVNSKTKIIQRKSSSRSQLLVAENSSMQLVPFGQDHAGNERGGGVLAAIDFAFKNGVKLMTDSPVSRSMMLAFLQQITHEPDIDFHSSERKGNIKISAFHINEISKGAKKLNILARRSEGVNTGIYSIEIGKELFQSANDLVESLKMLAGLQEAAKNMNTQKKSRIRLLEDNEEDNNKKHKQATLESQKQMDRPRFSFDKPSNSSKIREENTRITQRSVALAYLTNIQLPNSESNQSMVNTASQRRSNSLDGEFSMKTASSEKIKETSFNLYISKPEKKGLPNIIAKLMGLEEVSQHSESKNEMRKECESKLDDKSKMTPCSTHSHEKNRAAEFSQPQMGKKGLLLQADKIPIFLGSSFDIREKKRQSGDTQSPQSVGIKGRNKLQKDMENAENKSLRLTKRVGTQHQIMQNGAQERIDFANYGNMKNGTLGVPRSNQENTSTLLMKGKHQENNFENEIRNSNKKLAQKEKTAFSKRKLFGQPEIINQRHKPSSKEQKKTTSPKVNISVNEKQETQDHHTQISVSTSAKVRFSNLENPRTVSVSTSKQELYKQSDHNHVSNDHQVGAESRKTNNAPPMRDDNYIQAKTSLNKATESKVHKNTSLKMVEQMMIRNNSSQTSNRPDLTNNSSRSGTQKLKTTIKLENRRPDLTDTNQDTASQDSSHEHVPPCIIENTRELVACIIQSKEAGGVEKISSDILDCVQATAHKSCEAKNSNPLNEKETHLKCTLVLNQQFLNAAEALFKLNIPVNGLQADNHEHVGIEHKHILEAVEEIMKRKARRQELTVTKNIISSPRVRSLHDLVRQLNKDLETLEYYGGVWGDDTGAYLLKMVERDMQCTDPDINCMWNHSWNHTSFAIVEKDETIQELETFIIDDLIDHILNDM